MYFLLISIIFLIFTISSTEKCFANDDLICDCITDNKTVKISNCSRPGGWSEWTSWSKCRDGIKKRRRKCNNPSPMGTSCRGISLEKANCSIISKIPEFLFGTWSEWNNWSSCDCQRNQRTRTRFCNGKSCEGCHKDVDICENNDECPLIKKWTHWTEWVNRNGEQIRFSSYCESTNVQNLHVGTRTETQRVFENDNWSSWQMQSGIVFRSRLSQHSKIEIEHHLISRNISTMIPLYIVIFIGFLCILSGFSIQLIISLLFSKINRRIRREHFYDSSLQITNQKLYHKNRSCSLL